MKNATIYGSINIIDYMKWLGIHPQLCNMSDVPRIKDDIMYKLRHSRAKKDDKEIICSVIRGYMPVYFSKLQKKI